MAGGLYALIIPLIIIAALVIIIAVVLIYIKVNLQRFSKEAFGTKDFVKGVRQLEKTTSETPRSLHAMTSIYAPQITKDFPEFDCDAYIHKSQSVVRSYLLAIATKHTSALTEECSLTLKNSVQNIIEGLNTQGQTQHFEDIVIHGAEIARYLKSGPTVTIVFNVAVGMLSYIEDDKGKVVFGSRDHKKQTVYDVELVYVQDVDKMGVDGGGDSIGVHCPNCGAPVKTLGQKFCEYCGSGIMEVNVRAWHFDSVREQTVLKKSY